MRSDSHRPAESPLAEVKERVRETSRGNLRKYQAGAILSATGIALLWALVLTDPRPNLLQVSAASYTSVPLGLALAVCWTAGFPRPADLGRLNRFVLRKGVAIGGSVLMIVSSLLFSMDAGWQYGLYLGSLALAFPLLTYPPRPGPRRAWAILAIFLVVFALGIVFDFL